MSYFIMGTDLGYRARLPSLYSDFAPQRFSNPDGFTANVAAWQEGLAMAARAGVLSANGGSTVDTLSLKTGEPLLQALETKEWGRPLALRSVIVGTHASESHGLLTRVLINSCIGRINIKAPDDTLAGVHRSTKKHLYSGLESSTVVVPLMGLQAFGGLRLKHISGDSTDRKVCGYGQCRTSWRQGAGPDGR